MTEISEFINALFTNHLIRHTTLVFTIFATAVYYIVTIMQKHGNSNIVKSVREIQTGKPVNNNFTVKNDTGFENMQTSLSGLDVDKKIISALRYVGFEDIRDRDLQTSTGYNAGEVFDQLEAVMRSADDLANQASQIGNSGIISSGIINAEVRYDEVTIHMHLIPNIKVNRKQLSALNDIDGFRGIINNNLILNVRAFDF